MSGSEHPLHVAARDGDLEALGRLISEGADVDWDEDPDKDCPLDYAAINDQIDAARFLIERGADVFHRDRSGYTPFDTAIGRGAARVAGLLFDLQTREDPDRLGTVLHAAAVLGLGDLVAAEIAGGADVEKSDEGGQTPLALAISSWDGTVRKARLILSRRRGLTAGPREPERERLRVIRLLLEGGADPNREARGWSALRLAVHGGRLDILEILLAHGGDLSGPQRLALLADTAAHGGQAEALRFLLARGFDPRVEAGGGICPLHTAAWMGHLDCARVLLEARADPRGRDPWARTPADRARERMAGEVRMLEMYRLGGDAPKRAELEAGISRFQSILQLLGEP